MRKYAKAFITPILVAASLGAIMTPSASAAANGMEYARHDFQYRSHYVEVMGSKMHYVDTGGEGDPIVLLHGQPTWSYLWRNVIPHLEEGRRVIALDLIGFGKSDKPDIDYTVEQHAQYLEGFMDALALDDMTLVIHDWGSFLGFDYANKHRDRVKAIAFMEAVVGAGRPPADYKPTAEEAKMRQEFFGIIQTVRTPQVGEKAINEDNLFIETGMPKAVVRKLTEDEMNAYREPFPAGSNRKPMLQFPRQISFDGKNPAYVVNGLTAYSEYLTTASEMPLLMLHASPGFIGDRWQVQWVEENYRNVETQALGAGKHYVQEDHPEKIGKSIANWMKRKGL